MIHAYSNNGNPQIRLGFPNGYTVSLVVSGDGTAALAHWPTFNDEGVEPRKFTEEDRAARAAAVVLGEQRANAIEVMLYLQMVEALPPPENEDGQVSAKGAKG